MKALKFAGLITASTAVATALAGPLVAASLVAVDCRYGGGWLRTSAPASVTTNDEANTWCINTQGADGGRLAR